MTRLCRPGQLTTANIGRASGVGIINPKNPAGVFTSRLRDFNKNLVESLGFRLDGFNVPILLVIKKNKSILDNLETWLVEYNAGPDGTIAAPTLTPSFGQPQERNPDRRFATRP